MSLMRRLFALDPAPPSPIADYWYRPVSTPTLAGVRMSPERALTLSAVFQGTRLYAETLGSLPGEIKRREGKIKNPDATHPLYPLLHDQPNEYQSSQEWIEFMTGVAVLRGNAVSEVLSSPRGFVAQLLPIHPDRVTIERVPNTYRLQYRVQNLDGGGFRTLPREQVFHLRGFGSDGFLGLSVADLARQSLGLSLAMQEYAARLYGQGVRPPGALTVPGLLQPPQRAELAQSIRETYGGLAGSHQPLLLEGGMTWTTIGLSNKDAEFIAGSGFQIRDVARWLNLPVHMLHAEETPTYASVEQFGRELVMYSFRPWAHRWRQAVQVQLITDPDIFFEINLDALLQGTTLERYQAHRLALGGRAWESINEVRELEGLPPDAAEDSDTVQQPANIGTLPGDPKQAAEDMAPMPPPPPMQGARLDALLVAAATRAVHRELEAVRKAATKTAGDSAAWRTWVDEFYARHAAYLAEALALPLATVRPYVTEHRAALLAFGVGATGPWETEAVPALVALQGESSGAAARSAAGPESARSGVAAPTVVVENHLGTESIAHAVVGGLQEITASIAKVGADSAKAAADSVAAMPAVVGAAIGTAVAEALPGAVRAGVPAPPRAVEKLITRRDANGRILTVRETRWGPDGTPQTMRTTITRDAAGSIIQTRIEPDPDSEPEEGA